MNNRLLVTFEILVVVVTPLIFLYLKGNWPLRTIIPCLLSIPILWYLTCSPLHELSHVAGTYLVGGKVIYVKLIPKFLFGEFARAWITPEGITQPWQQLVTSGSAYMLDIVCIIAGTSVSNYQFLVNRTMPKDLGKKTETIQ